MLENQETRLEEASSDEVNEASVEKGKITFPLAGIITLGVIALLMIACIIVIVILQSKA